MGSLFDSFDYAYLNNVKTIVPGKTLVGGSPAGESAISSFFGRVNYNFKETYLASVILRTDGSSNFARGNRWGYFPSVSLGWVISNEAFMDIQRCDGFLKIRASWGKRDTRLSSIFGNISFVRRIISSVQIKCLVNRCLPSDFAE